MTQIPPNESINDIIDAYNELWENVENGTVGKNFFELRARIRNVKDEYKEITA